MMRRSFFALFSALGFNCLTAQTPPPTVTLSAQHLTMGAGGANLPNGSQICVLTTDANDRPAGYRIGGFGQTSASASMVECHTVTAGNAPSFTVLNSGASSPANACLRVTLQLPSGQEIRRDRCVQTGTADSFASGFCTQVSGTVTCSYDAYPVGTAPVQLTQYGPAGPQGATGCVLGQTCTSKLTPQSINNILYPDAFPGADLAARVTAALASLGGTQASPVNRATVYAMPGVSYTTSTVVLPNCRTAPYVCHTDLHFIGNALTPSASGAPLIHVLAQNGNGGAPGTRIDGGTFNPPGAGIPTIQVDSNIGFELSNATFNGGLPLRFVNTYFEDGSTPGYNEQWFLHNNDFITPAGPAVEFSSISGGTNSALYGIGDKTNHFQLACGQTAYQVDSGVEIQGGELSGHINTSGGETCSSSNYVALIKSNGSIYRNTVSRFYGEDTGGTGQLYFFGGSADATISNLGVTVTGMQINAPGSDTFSHLTLPYNDCTTALGTQSCATVQDEGHGLGFVLSRKSLVELGQTFRMWIGAEPGSASQAVYYTPNYNDTPQTATAIRSIYRADGNGVGFGPGFSEKTPSGACMDAAGCNEPGDVIQTPSITIGVPGALYKAQLHMVGADAHLTVTSPNTTPGQPSGWLYFDGYNSSGPPPYNTMSTGAKGRFENGFFDWYQQGNYDALSYSVNGAAGWSGTCASPKNLVVTNGLVTGCQ